MYLNITTSSLLSSISSGFFSSINQYYLDVGISYGLDSNFYDFNIDFCSHCVVLSNFNTFILLSLLLIFFFSLLSLVSLNMIPWEDRLKIRQEIAKNEHLSKYKLPPVDVDLRYVNIAIGTPVSTPTGTHFHSPVTGKFFYDNSDVDSNRINGLFNDYFIVHAIISVNGLRRTGYFANDQRTLIPSHRPDMVNPVSAPCCTDVFTSIRFDGSRITSRQSRIYPYYTREGSTKHGFKLPISQG